MSKRYKNKLVIKLKKIPKNSEELILPGIKSNDWDAPSGSKIVSKHRLSQQKANSEFGSKDLRSQQKDSFQSSRDTARYFSKTIHFV